MTLTPEGVRRRRRVHAIVFLAAGLVILGLIGLGEDDPSRLAPLLLALPLVALARGSAGCRAVVRFGRRLGAKPLASASLVGALAFVSSIALSLPRGLPEPAIHDEFSYLLAADTFAHGRLTNPAHPMWVFFEAPHILQQPTYTSKYPPAQGLALALGQISLGHPIAGVWLSAGLACGALAWMLAGWGPGRWALAGGLLGVVHPLTCAWSQTYWGGLVAVLGGALVLGALRRIARRPRARHAIVLGLGLGILANSRPYEGLALALPLLTALGIWIVSRYGPPARTVWNRLLVPLATVILLVGGGMLYYNYRVTGDPLATAYSVHQRTYARRPLFIFQDPLPAPLYRHERLQGFYTDVPPRPAQRSLTGLADSVRRRAAGYAFEYVRSLLVPFVVVLLFPLERKPWYLAAMLGVVLFTVALGLQSWAAAHYAAPAAALALLVAVRAVRGVGRWRLGQLRVGRSIVQALMVVIAGVLVLQWWHTVSGPRRTGWNYDRARIARSLIETGGQHLILVRYGPGHYVGMEWVYNAADIDAAPVVWASEMDAASNVRLLDYFRDRRVWLVEPDVPEVRAIPYPPLATPEAAVPRAERACVPGSNVRRPPGAQLRDRRLTVS